MKIYTKNSQIQLHYLIKLAFFFSLSFCSLSSFSGEVTFSLTPLVEKGISNSHVWTLPVPNNLIKKADTLHLVDNQGNIITTSNFSIVMLWPSLHKQTYIRSLVISAKELSYEKKYLLKWQSTTHGNINSNISHVNITDHANLSPDWLSLTFYSPMMPFEKNITNGWFDHSSIHYGKFIVQPNLVPKYNFKKTKASVWLYDRPFNLYLLYLKTGDIFWKIKAHEEANYYLKHIDKNGYFSLKSGDMKYLNTQGLVLDYIFYPSQKTLKVINQSFKLTLDWPTKVKNEGFWTERHHSVALSAALSEWVTTGDKKSLQRINDFIDETYNFLSKEYNANCLKHSYLSHEGKKINTKVCSPWMSALIIEQFWRFYHLTGDYKSTVIIEKLTDFVLKQGYYNFTYGKEFSAVPKYLALLNAPEKENRDPWSDINHACDVSASIAKGLYLKKIKNSEAITHSEILPNMLKTCYRSMFRTNAADAWPIVPPRKFNWWYGTTASFTWLLNELNIKHK